MKLVITLIKSIGGIALACGGLWIFYKQVDWSVFTESLTKITWYQIVGVSILVVATLYFRAARLQYFIGKEKIPNLFGQTMIGFMINNILPARLGEVARASLIWNSTSYKLARCIGGLILERIVDVGVFMLFFIAPVLLMPQIQHKPFLPQSPFTMAHAAIVVACAFSVVVMVFIGLRFFRARLDSIVRFCLRPFPQKIHNPLYDTYLQFAHCSDWLFDKGSIMMVGVHTFLSMICYPLMMMLLGKDIAGFGFVETSFVQAFSALGAAIPLVPGYIGTVHASITHAMTTLGIDSGRAGAFAVWYHALNYTVVTIIGLYFYFTLQFSFKQIRRTQAKLHEQK